MMSFAVRRGGSAIQRPQFSVQRITLYYIIIYITLYYILLLLYIIIQIPDFVLSFLRIASENMMICS